MLPTTSAVAIQRPIERLRRGFALGALGTVSVSDDMIPPSSDAGGVRVHPKPVLDRHLSRGLTCTIGARCVQLQRPVRVGGGTRSVSTSAGS